MKILWKPLVVAGISGYLFGRIIRVAKKNPDITIPLLKNTAYFTVVGVATGVGVAYYRKEPLHIYGISVGANFAVAAFTFFGVRQVIKEQLISMRPSDSGDTLPIPSSGTDSSEPKRRKKLETWEGYVSSGTSGTFAGFLTSAVSRYGVAEVMRSSVGGLVVGVLGQFLYQFVEKLWLRMAVRYNYPELLDPKKMWTFENFERRFVSYWNAPTKADGLETQLAVMKEDIAAVKRRIAMIDKELEQMGYHEQDMNLSNDEKIT